MAKNSILCFVHNADKSFERVTAPRFLEPQD